MPADKAQANQGVRVVPTQTDSGISVRHPYQKTHKRFKRTLIFYDIGTQSANIRGSPLHQAIK